VTSARGYETGSSCLWLGSGIEKFQEIVTLEAMLSPAGGLHLGTFALFGG